MEFSFGNEEYYKNYMFCSKSVFNHSKKCFIITVSPGDQTVYIHTYLNEKVLFFT